MISLVLATVAVGSWAYSSTCVSCFHIPVRFFQRFSFRDARYKNSTYLTIDFWDATHTMESISFQATTRLVFSAAQVFGGQAPGLWAAHCSRQGHVGATETHVQCQCLQHGATQKNTSFDTFVSLPQPHCVCFKYWIYIYIYFLYILDYIWIQYLDGHFCRLFFWSFHRKPPTDGATRSPCWGGVFRWRMAVLVAIEIK